ncbi:winged helix-turn-helix domain-containing protein [Vibrio mediterranei]|uniref:Transcriptional regulator n=1 Tax=Vibrio mediterranei TaxID=689 RepID=A0ABX5DIA9_9VIBR|nr:winged helix-turn-helix domain-containing protein [Vibrio mediterranei]PCD89302.1 transcriptional regulator [Vibrio mediterranei]PRQ68336.1 transcriptional regulator [Vibrio mediterranei]
MNYHKRHDLVIDLDNRTLTKTSSDKVITLSPSECLILKHLMNNGSQTLGRDYLLTHCWPGRVVTNSSLNVAIKNIRNALLEVESCCKVITVQKEGYCLVVPEQSDVQVVGFDGSRSTVNADQPKLDAVNPPIEASDPSPSRYHSLVKLSQFSYQFAPFGAGIAVSILVMVLFFRIGFFMERTAINGIDVYHDNAALDSQLMADLSSLAKPGVEAIYMHRIGIECFDIQVVLLDSNGWQEIGGSYFQPTLCSEEQKPLEATEATPDEV